MSDPRTEAGRELWDHMQNWFDDASPDLILAIEAEAATPAETGLREALRAIPHGFRPEPGLASVAGWNRYDTDDEHVLHLFSGPDGQRSVSWDIRVPKADAALESPREER